MDMVAINNLKTIGHGLFNEKQKYKNSDINFVDIMDELNQEYKKSENHKKSSVYQPENNIGLPASSVNYAYGYKTDGLGFMGADFNKAAGLPQDFKIHKSTLDEIVRYNNKTYLFTQDRSKAAFEKIDVADTTKHYYKLFKSIVGDEKDRYSEADLANLPKGFSLDTNQKTFGKNANFLKDVSLISVTNVYKTFDQVSEAKSVRDELRGLGVSHEVYELNFSKEHLDAKASDEYTFNPDMSVYQADDTYSNAGMFVGFLKSFSPIASDSGETKLSVEASSYSKLMSEQSLADDVVPLSRLLKNEKMIKFILEELLKRNLLTSKDGKSAGEIVDSVLAHATKLQNETKI